MCYYRKIALVLKLLPLDYKLRRHQLIAMGSELMTLKDRLIEVTLKQQQILNIHGALPNDYIIVLYILINFNSNLVHRFMVTIPHLSNS